MADRKPPIAGPKEKPRFIAILFKENARVRFSGLAYRVTATVFAGRKVSLIRLCRKMMAESPISVLNTGSIQKRGTLKNRLSACTLYSPILSVISPPSQEPSTEPSPKKLSTIPALWILKPRWDVMYIPKNGNTIEPERLMSMTKASIQFSVESPLNELTYMFINLIKNGEIRF